MFVHTLPLHMNFENTLSVSELIEKSNQGMLLGIEHENYPFMQLADKFGYSTEIMYECQLGVSGKEHTIGDAAYTAQFMQLETHYQQLKSLRIDIQKHSAIFVNYTT